MNPTTTTTTSSTVNHHHQSGSATTANVHSISDSETTATLPESLAHAKMSREAGEASSVSKPEIIVEHPGPHDVLMGRGAPVSEHEGNTRLRNIVIARHADYVAPEKKRHDKHLVALEIVGAVKQEGGRFLRRHGDDAYGHWVVVHDSREIIRKVKQLLRDMAPQARERRAERHRLRAKNPRTPRGGLVGTGTGATATATSENQTAVVSSLDHPLSPASALRNITRSGPLPHHLESLTLPAVSPALGQLSQIDSATLLAELQRRTNLSEPIHSRGITGPPTLASLVLAGHPAVSGLSSALPSNPLLSLGGGSAAASATTPAAATQQAIDADVLARWQSEHVRLLPTWNDLVHAGSSHPPIANHLLRQLNAPSAAQQPPVALASASVPTNTTLLSLLQSAQSNHDGPTGLLELLRKHVASSDIRRSSGP